jgi:hypothetical protein
MVGGASDLLKLFLTDARSFPFNVTLKFPLLTADIKFLIEFLNDGSVSKLVITTMTVMLPVKRGEADKNEPIVGLNSKSFFLQTVFKVNNRDLLLEHLEATPYSNFIHQRRIQVIYDVVTKGAC